MSTRLRIAVLNRHFSGAAGGAERYSVQLVEHLAAHHEFHVFAQTIDHAWPGVHYHRVPMPLAKPRWLNQLWYAFATAWATRRGFDLVHSHENTWHGQVQTVHVRAVRYSLLHGRSGLARWWQRLRIATSPRLWVYLGLEALRFRTLPGRQIVVASTALGEELRQAYPQVQPRLLTPGVTLPPGHADKAAARRQLGLPPTLPLLLFVANDFAKKGLGTLLHALAQLPAEVHLAVVGQPSQQAHFAAQAQSLGLAPRLHFLGRLADVGPAYDAADVLAHPTTEDSFAMVVLEALAHRLPVVVSGLPYCGMAALLTHQTHALLLPEPQDAHALAQALARVLGDTALRDRLAQAGWLLAQAHQWAAQAHAQQRIYRDARGRAE